MSALFAGNLSALDDAIRRVVNQSSRRRWTVVRLVSNSTSFALVEYSVCLLHRRNFYLCESFLRSINFVHVVLMTILLRLLVAL